MLLKYTTGMLFTNSYVIVNDDNECVVVDPGLGYKNVALKINSEYKVKAILITHGHFDHIDGIKYFNAPIYISKEDEEFLYNKELSLYSFYGMNSPFKKGDLDIRYVKDGDIIDLIGYKFEVLQTPGHTIGSVCYSFDKVVLSGDTLFDHSCGRCDFPTGNQTLMHESLLKIVNHYDLDMVVFPGHNDKTTIEIEKNENPYI